MAQLTKLQARTFVQQLIDDPNAKLWSAANLDLLIEGVLDELWADLLEHAPYLRSTEYTATSLPAINISTLLTRFHRVQNVVRDSIVYTPADPKDVTYANNTVVDAPNRTYTIFGGTLYMFPAETSPDAYVRYSSYPTRFNSLADGDSVEWPDGHHLAYVYAAASRAMEKGDREDNTRMERRAEGALLKLKAKLRKEHTGPAMPWMDSDSLEWGGV